MAPTPPRGLGGVQGAISHHAEEPCRGVLWRRAADAKLDKRLLNYVLGRIAPLPCEQFQGRGVSIQQSPQASRNPCKGRFRVNLALSLLLSVSMTTVRASRSKKMRVDGTVVQAPRESLRVMTTGLNGLCTKSLPRTGRRKTAKTSETGLLSVSQGVARENPHHSKTLSPAADHSFRPCPMEGVG